MSLHARLRTALDSRKERNILRRIPDPIPSHQGVDFYTNDYLSLASNPVVRQRFLQKLQASQHVSGSGGSRLLVNSNAHEALEGRLAQFFDAPSALLFNSGFDANVGFFSCIPGENDVVLYDEYIHASVHDGMRASRAKNALFPFKHNSVQSLEELVLNLIKADHHLLTGEHCVFVAIESLYSMDGDFAPLVDIVDLVERILPMGNGHVVVDEAHATGIYGRQGRGLVSLLGLEHRITARLHTFGKALACNGAVLLVHPLIRSYLINYARSLIYTTTLSHSLLTAIDASFDLLTDGTIEHLASHLHGLFNLFVNSLEPRLKSVPPHALSLPKALLHPDAPPTPIIPVMTSKARPLAAYLNERGLLARPITWPTVPKGADRVRICLHAGNTPQDIERLVNVLLTWTSSQKSAETSIEAKL